MPQGLHEWRARCCEAVTNALGSATDHLLSELAASIKLLGASCSQNRAMFF